VLLRGGVNDLGGTLMEETISRMAGSQHGSAKTVAQLHEIVAGLPSRRARQRLTDYGTVPAERLAVADRFTGVLPSLEIRAV
jgi:FO synthase